MPTEERTTVRSFKLPFVKNLTRKTVKSIINGWSKDLVDLRNIIEEEDSRININTLKIEQLNTKNAGHRFERDQANQLIENLKGTVLKGIVDKSI